MFKGKYARFWREFGSGRQMVLSTSSEGAVSSRMMSIVRSGEKLYFQTDRNSRKYSQLSACPRAALCIGNIQLEGRCRELGSPADHAGFCAAYRELYPASFERYTMLRDERLFVFEPVYAERWLYVGSEPHVEVFDVEAERYSLTPYTPE